jgi:hypothetical protein
MFETSGGYFGRFSNLFQNNSNLNLNLARSTLALHIPLSLSFSFSCKPTKGREGDLLGISLWSQGIFKNIFCLSYSLGIEGKRRSPRPPCQYSLPFDHPTAVNPQRARAVPAGTLA